MTLVIVSPKILIFTIVHPVSYVVIHVLFLFLDTETSMSKIKLQNFAQKRNMNLPAYGFVREGPPHAPCFKATVTVDNQTFESPAFLQTLKEAEHAAARVALEALAPQGPEVGTITLASVYTPIMTS